MKWMLTLALLATGCAAQRANNPGPDPVVLRKQLARTLLSYREWEVASHPLRELVIARPADPEVRAMLGTTYRELGLYPEAEAEYRKATALDPRQAEAFEGLGILADLRGTPGDEALLHLRQAIALQPENAAYHNNLGFALSLRGRLGEAETAFREALRRDPSVRRFRNNLGFTYAQRGNFQEAGREFERGGSPAFAQNNLGFALERAGQTEAACQHYREAELLDPQLEAASMNAKRVCASGSLRPAGSEP